MEPCSLDVHSVNVCQHTTHGRVDLPSLGRLHPRKGGVFEDTPIHVSHQIEWSPYHARERRVSLRKNEKKTTTGRKHSYLPFILAEWEEVWHRDTSFPGCFLYPTQWYKIGSHDHNAQVTWLQLGSHDHIIIICCIPVFSLDSMSWRQQFSWLEVIVLQHN